MGDYFVASVDPPLPATLNVGEKLSVVVEYRPQDSTFQVGQIVPISSSCTTIPVALSGGVPGVVKEDPLTIVTPNGGERYMLGWSVPIEWSGSLPDDTVRLEYSVDGGDSWQLITDSATDNLYLWSPPEILSERCLVRAYLQSVAGERGFVRLDGSDRVWSVDVSPSGGLIAVGYEDGSVALHLTVDGSLVRLDPPPRDNVVLRSVQFSPDETELLMNTTGPEIYLRSLLDGTERRIDHVTRVDYSVYSSDGKSIISAASLTGQLLRHNRASLALEDEVDVELSLTVRTIANSGEGDLLVLGAYDFLPRLFQESTLDSIGVGPVHGGPIQAVDVNWDGNRLIVAGLTGDVDLVGLPESELVGGMKRPYTLHAASFSSSSGVAAVAGGATVGGEGNPVDLLNATNGLSLHRRLFGHKDVVTSLAFSPDTRHLVSGSWDSSAIIWDLSLVPQSSDSSDAFFALVDVTLQGGRIGFGAVPVGDSRDMVGIGILCNHGTEPVLIDSLSVEGNVFRIRSAELPTLLSPGDCIDVEVGFVPESAQPYNGVIHFYHGSGSTRAELLGVGVRQSLVLRVKSVDMGAVPIGESKDSLVQSTLINQTPFPIALRNPRFRVQSTMIFEAPSSIEGATLMPGDSLALVLRFSPQYKGRVQGELLIDYGAIRALVDTGTVGIEVIGYGTCPLLPSRSDLHLPRDLHASPGSAVSVPMIVSRQIPRDRVDRRYSLLISWDATLLSLNVEGVVASIVHSSGRTFALLEGSWNQRSDTLVNLPFIAGLGGATETDIAIHSIEFEDGCDGGVVANDGLVRIDSICTDPEHRLFFETERALLRSPVPNPMQSEATIDYRVIEEGRVLLQLVDAHGAVVRTMVRRFLPPGRYRRKIERFGLSAGVYWVRLQTETQDLIQPLVLH